MSRGSMADGASGCASDAGCVLSDIFCRRSDAELKFSSASAERDEIQRFSTLPGDALTPQFAGDGCDVIFLK